MKKILNKILSVLCIALIVLLLIFVVLKTFFGAREAIYIAGYSAVRIVSGSMEPTIMTNDYILLKRYSEDMTLKVGDVIMFHSEDERIEGQLNTHRIVEILGEGEDLRYATKGDNSLATDETTVSRSDISGVFLRVLPIISFIGALVSTKFGFFVAILAPLAAYLAILVRDAVKTAKEKAAQKKNELVQQELEKLVQSGEINQLIGTLKPEETELYAEEKDDSEG